MFHVHLYQLHTFHFTHTQKNNKSRQFQVHFIRQNYHIFIQMSCLPMRMKVRVNFIYFYTTLHALFEDYDNDNITKAAKL